VNPALRLPAARQSLSVFTPGASPLAIERLFVPWHALGFERRPTDPPQQRQYFLPGGVQSLIDSVHLQRVVP